MSLIAIKNAVEQQGMRAAHIRDGVALCHYFAWLENLIEGGGEISEADAAKVAEARRAEQQVRSAHALSPHPAFWSRS